RRWTRCSGSGRRGPPRSSWMVACGDGGGDTAGMGETQPAARSAQGTHYRGCTRRLPRRVARMAAFALVAAALAGCGGGDRVRPAGPMPGSWSDHRPADPAAANAVLMRAIGLVGTPYRYGGNSPEGGFDCSGLVNYVFRDMLDLQLPRTSRALAAYQGPRIE